MPAVSQPTEHTNSYYAASRRYLQERPSLEDNVHCHFCVLGAGFTGIASALHLAEAGFSVVVLEAARVGFGASGRNGGQLVNSYSRDMDVIARRHGDLAARALGDMAFEGADIIRQKIQQYQIDCDYRPGGIFAAFNAHQMQALQEQQSLWQQYGHRELTLLDREAIRGEIDSPRYIGGLLDHRGGHMHPLNLVLGEAQALESLGGRIFEHSRVHRIERSAKPVLHTARGSVTADYCLLAGNAYLGNLEPELASKSMPCGTQIVTSEVLDEDIAQSLIPNRYCVEDCNYKLDYYRVTADNRLLYGGGVTYGGGDPASIERFLRPHIEHTFPQLHGINLDYKWGGDFLLTVSRLPQIGRLTPNIYYAQGYSGHGVTTTHLVGKLMAEAARGQAERFDAFAALPHVAFPGGRALRVPYTMLGAAYYGLRDRLGI